MPRKVTDLVPAGQKPRLWVNPWSGFIWKATDQCFFLSKSINTSSGEDKGNKQILSFLDLKVSCSRRQYLEYV